MTARHLIILISIIPTIIYGQRHDCFYKQPSWDTASCYLIPIKKLNDTAIAILPKDCRYVQFDSTVNGQWKVYLSDTTTLYEIVSLNNGKENGKFIRYYSNGKILAQSEFKNGELNGDYISFDAVGNIRCKGYWRNNLFYKGKIMEYWDNGNIASLEIHKKGSSKHTKYWDKNGNKVDWEKFSKEFNDCF